VSRAQPTPAVAAAPGAPGSRRGPAPAARARARRVQPGPAPHDGLTMWVPPLVLTVAVLGYPLFVAPARGVLVIGLAALVLCALGLVVRSGALVTAGGVLALGQYALALWLAAAPPRLAGAVLFGVGLMLLVETADFSRRVRGATLGPGLVASQVRYWGGFAGLAGSRGLCAAGLATAASAVGRLPWAPAVAAGAGARGLRA